MADPRFHDKSVKAAYLAMPAPQRELALRLRRLVFATASRTAGVGRIGETLRWQQPSYLTSESGSGSTIRIDAVSTNSTEVALYFHCQTGLVSDFREIYGESLRYQGERALLFDIRESITEKSVSHCVGLALTYHQRKKKRD